MSTDTDAAVDDAAATDDGTKQTEPTEAEKELQAKYDAAILENKRIKGTMSATDKKLAALQKETEEFKLSTMNEKDKEIELAKKEREISMNQTKQSLVEKLELDEVTADLLNSNNGADMVDKAEKLKAYKDAVRKEADEQITALKQEIESLKGNMGNPGGGNKNATGLSGLSLMELNSLVLNDPTKKAAVIAEIEGRNKPK